MKDLIKNQEDIEVVGYYRSGKYYLQELIPHSKQSEREMFAKKMRREAV